MGNVWEREEGREESGAAVEARRHIQPMLPAQKLLFQALRHPKQALIDGEVWPPVFEPENGMHQLKDELIAKMEEQYQNKQKQNSNALTETQKGNGREAMVVAELVEEQKLSNANKFAVMEQQQCSAGKGRRVRDARCAPSRRTVRTQIEIGIFRGRIRLLASRLAVELLRDSRLER
uniref:Mediator of RNA polymerase II transcription subunit 8 n=1 Tax=Globodera pallida TaxID=36090 RepID=A0A183CFS9_GLOPA